MSTLHSLRAYAAGNLTGLQLSRRDWSPYVAHFTSWSAMAPLRRAIEEGRKPGEINDLFLAADLASLKVVEKMAATDTLRANSPGDGLPACVCFSECTIAGLIGLSETYGRFGLVFRKTQISNMQGVPCAYLPPEEYGEIRGAFASSTSARAQRIVGMINVLRPPGQGKVQDFSHDREWRVFADVNLREAPPAILLAPALHLDEIRDLFPTPPVVPLDSLWEWGA